MAAAVTSVCGGADLVWSLVGRTAWSAMRASLLTTCGLILLAIRSCACGLIGSRYTCYAIELLYTIGLPAYKQVKPAIDEVLSLLQDLLDQVQSGS